MKGNTLIWATRGAIFMAGLLVLSIQALPHMTGRPAPLLFLLLASEFGWVLSLVGTTSAILRLKEQNDQRPWLQLGICVLLAIAFTLAGLSFWSHATAAGANTEFLNQM
ncbi:MAG: hypothetical protein J4A00_01790 [Gammaproteobacteria bacterium]|nr:hypothetical protein [Gammaproteobacteria bacterium]